MAPHIDSRSSLRCISRSALREWHSWQLASWVSAASPSTARQGQLRLRCYPLRRQRREIHITTMQRAHCYDILEYAATFHGNLHNSSPASVLLGGRDTRGTLTGRSGGHCSTLRLTPRAPAGYDGSLFSRHHPDQHEEMKRFLAQRLIVCRKLRSADAAGLSQPRSS